MRIIGKYNSIVVKNLRIISNNQNMISIFLLLTILASYVRVFQVSIKNGRVGGEPTYDDITYFLDGRYRLIQLLNTGIDGLSSWISTPPHSPILSLISTLCQAVQPNSHQFIYFVYGLLIISIFYACFKLVFISNVKTLFFLLFLVSSPLGTFFFFNFRPDTLYAVIVALMYAHFIKMGPLKFANFFFIYFAILFLTKPTFIAFTALNFSVIFCFLFLFRKSENYNLRAILRSLLIAIVGVSWYLPKGVKSIYDYVVENTLGKNKDIWVGSSIVHEFLVNMRNMLIIFTPLFVGLICVLTVAAFFAIRIEVKSLQDIRVLYIVAVLNALIAASSRIQNPFFYLSALMLILVSISIYINTLLLRFRVTPLQTLALAFFILIAAPSLKPVEWGASEIRKNDYINQKSAELFETYNPSRILFFFAGTLNPDTINWFLNDESRSLKIDSLALEIRSQADVLDSMNNLGAYDLIVTRKFNVNGFPSDSLQENINEQLLKNDYKEYSMTFSKEYIYWRKLIA